METYHIIGGTPLQGEVPVCGAKNAALPLLAAAVLCDGISIIHHCPRLTDVEAARRILVNLGCDCRWEGDTLTVDARNVTTSEIPHDLMREMRSSIVFLGAIVGRLGGATLSFPGGCELGPRPIDLHLAALRSLGLTIEESHGVLCCHTDGLKGTELHLSFPSVGATENVLLAACVAQDTTVLTNPAREPEIVNLAAFLNAAGADIRGAGSSRIEIHGVKKLHGGEITVIPDRIVAATYLAAAAATGGHIRLTGVALPHLTPILPCFQAAGCRLRETADTLELTAPTRLGAIPTVRTLAWPGFPTDAMPVLLAAMTTGSGTSVFVENIFENRYRFVDELRRMGADVRVEGRVAVVEGVPALSGAMTSAGDLRGGAAIMVAALAARGETTVEHIEHIKRGYPDIAADLRRLGATVWLEK